MTSYRIEHPQKGLIEYRDKKRLLWVLAILFTLLPLVTFAMYFQIPSVWVLIMPLLVSYLFVPVVDYLMGSDTSNPPEEIVPVLDADPYYHRLLEIAAGIHFVVLIAAAWFVVAADLSLVSMLLVAVMVGIYNGASINTAHEVGHKNIKRNRLLSRIVLAVTGYGHFCIEHNLGHHRDVSTPEDPASSRMGESIYRFMLREIPGAFKRGWRAESLRLQKRGHATWSPHNHILQSYAMTLLLQGGLVLLLGWILLPFFLIHNMFAWFQLTSANYIEHYGLLREKKSDGRYERCQPHHSWNANHIFSNILLFQLERHSDHHANPSRSYQSLRSFENLPELPSGYFGMYWLAYHPPLWFKVMDKRLLAIPHINGDMNKVNVDPKHADRLWREYGRLEERLAG